MVGELEYRGVFRWSTAEVPAADRVERYAAALSDAIIPLAVRNADSATFQGEVSAAQLGAIRISKVVAASHGVLRGPREFARSREHHFVLTMALDCAWTANHRGKLRLKPGDILVHDSSYPLSLEMPDTWVGVNVVLPYTWLRGWIPNPGKLVGRRIDRTSAWGGALSAYLAELSPELVAAPPLPPPVLADQIGSLMALTVDQLAVGERPKYRQGARQLHDLITDCIVQRCTEVELTAHDVAQATNISVRTLHRTLAVAGDTFGATLILARVRAAERMLTSPLFNRVTTREIGLRAGFQSASHFARAVRKQTGCTPKQLRRPGHESDS